MASFSIPRPKSSSPSSLSGVGSAPFHNQQQLRQSKVSYNWNIISRPSALVGGWSPDDSAPASKPQLHYQRKSAIWKVYAQQKKVVAEKSLNTPPLLETAASSPKKDESLEKAVQNACPDASSMSAFMARVTDIVKLVDSRDIMELQLKQQDCELIIRKKEALQPPPPSVPSVMMHSPVSNLTPPSIPAPSQVVAATPATTNSSPSPPPPPSPTKAAKSSHSSLKCPMAGTFYRSPAPGAPPFVKVGDKVQKGQVLCIIEAMKLMNEIECDQSGTVVEIQVEDGKPVSVDTPLFLIAPS